MKIVYCITKGTWGGAQKYVLNLAAHGKEKGHDVVIVSGKAGILLDECRKRNIRTILIPELDRDINPFLDAASLFRLISVLRSEKPDVLHLNSSKIAGLGAVAARLTNVPRIVFTAHGWPFLEERPRTQAVTIIFFSWLTALFSHVVIDITEATFKRVYRWPLVGHKMRLIYNGVDTKTLPLLDRMAARKQLGIEDGVFAIGLATEFTKNKGVTYALEAFARIKNPASRLIIVGRGELEEKLKLEARELGISDRVQFKGFLPEVSRYFKAFDIIIVPSIKEGLPLTVIEAGHANVPVVATNVGGIPELLDRECGILVESKNPDALAGAIESLMENEELRNRLAARFGQKVRASFGLKPMLRKTFNLYESNNPEGTRKGSLFIPINQNGEILMNLRAKDAGTNPDQWCILGGSQDGDEDPETTARRELKEETGLEGTHFSLIAQTNQYHVYRVDVVATQDEVIVGEGQAMEFFTPDKLIELMDSLPYENRHLVEIRKLIESKAL